MLTDILEVGKDKQKNEQWDLDRDVRDFPAVSICYLGVDSRFRGLRHGEYILLEAMRLAIRVSADVGCRFITVKAYPSSAPFYEKYGFVSSSNKRKPVVRIESYKSLCACIGRLREAFQVSPVESDEVTLEPLH